MYFCLIDVTRIEPRLIMNHLELHAHIFTLNVANSSMVLLPG